MSWLGRGREVGSGGYGFAAASCRVDDPAALLDLMGQEGGRRCAFAFCAASLAGSSAAVVADAKQGLGGGFHLK